MNGYRVLTRLSLTLVCIICGANLAVAGDEWKPIDPNHLAMKEAVVEKGADAEAIFWEVHINDSARDLVFSHYIRIKVFTERGKESQSKIDITYRGQNKIVDIAGRTIKPDGSIVELKKDAIFDRTIIKAGEFKVKAKTFAMPAVEPGVIIEYRWKEIRPDQMANNIRLQFQREIPIQFVKYYLKPAQMDVGLSSLGMSYRTFNGEASPPLKDKDGFYTTSMSNVPALHEEPRMPPENQVKIWMLLFYSRDRTLPPQEYWPKLGRELSDAVRSGMKVNDDVKKAAAAAIGDATTPEQKLQRIFEFCRTRIKNSTSATSGLTDADRDKLKKNESPADTLKHGIGDSGDIDQLFAAMATAAGFEARAAAISDRSDIFFDKNFTNSYFLRAIDIAVKVGNEWRFFEPGTAYVPFGMIRWQQEALPALILDQKEPVFVQTPASTADKTVQKRTGNLTLAEDGTLEGDVRIEYTGHLAVEKKDQNEDDSPSQREETLRELVKSQMSTAELSNIKIENVTDLDKPFVYSFHVRVPGYAQRTGKRLFLQPAFFRKGIAAMFPASTRKLPIYFHYAWKEEDNITISLPAGFALDNADRPEPLKAGDVAEYEVLIGVTTKGDELHYKRSFKFNALIIPASSYTALKNLFDMIHERDNHTITLKQAAAAQ